MTIADQTTGRCLCGEIRFKFDPQAVRWQGHCTCESCRRATASPITTFIGVGDSGWRWIGDRPAMYESSQGVRRFFCSRCGTQMAYAADRHPEETHFYTATLLDPTAAKPTVVYHSDEALHWMPLPSGVKRK